MMDFCIVREPMRASYKVHAPIIPRFDLSALTSRERLLQILREADGWVRFTALAELADMNVVPAMQFMHEFEERGLVYSRKEGAYKHSPRYYRISGATNA